ncbi:MAG: transketolase [Alphaproteobacteria bacterium]|nr:transketolase [Alphaproteobacteria bacterium]
MPTPLPLANAIRVLSMDAVEKAQSGHVGLPLGMADAATVLFMEFLQFDPLAPSWPDRDRFVLSNGHGSMLLYSLLHLTGYPEITLDEIRNFRQLGSKTPGHPEHGHTQGVETTTGPLGQGFANAVGMAIAERHLNTRFGDDLVDHKTYVIVGDGCLMEGVSQEALTLAGHLKLSKLIVLFDDNAVTIDGSTQLSDTTDQVARFKASGWNTREVDGHDPAAVRSALQAAQTSDRPTLIACRTIIGYGAPKLAGTGPAHGGPYGAEEIAGIRLALNWAHEPFHLPEDIVAAWRMAGARGAKPHAEWRDRLARSDLRSAFEDAIAGRLPAGAGAAIGAHKKKVVEAARSDATRKWSGAVLEVLTDLIPEMVGGSADLTGSNNTRTATASAPLTAENHGGRYIHYGIREHAMAAAMNGMALHGGMIPYSGTFLVFSDYSRPAIRLGALMGQRVIHVMTHDSIGVGEDGPTHQPVEHVASLRAMPNLLVFRPCDGVEAAECWQAALDSTDAPSLIALTRQNLAPARTTHVEENLCARGGYVLSPAKSPEKIVLIATGSEVEIALAAQASLEAEGIGARVVSLPCFALFEAQTDAYRSEVLGGGLPKVAVEAGVRTGWDRWIGPEGGFVGMKGFGASAPAKTLYSHFGITAEAVVKAARERT